MPYNELTNKYLEGLKTKIREVMFAKNLNDTSGTSESLEIQENKLLANSEIYFLDQGRSPGTFPPVDKIKEWMVNKLGLDAYGEDSGIAFLIGRKMKNEGSEIFKDKSKGIQLDTLVDEMLNELLKELPDTVAVEALKWL